MRAALIVIVASLWLPATALAQPNKNPTPPPSSATINPATPLSPHARESYGDGQLAVGESAPNFELDSSVGRRMRLSELRGGWVLLVFGSRKESVAPMAKVNDEAGTLGVTIVGVCDEKAYNLVSFSEREQLPFVILADVTDEIAQMYGLYDAERRTTAPGFVLVDPKGVVRTALLGQTLPPKDIMELVRFKLDSK